MKNKNIVLASILLSVAVAGNVGAKEGLTSYAGLQFVGYSGELKDSSVWNEYYGSAISTGTSETKTGFGTNTIGISAGANYGVTSDVFVGAEVSLNYGNLSYYEGEGSDSCTSKTAGTKSCYGEDGNFVDSYTSSSKQKNTLTSLYDIKINAGYNLNDKIAVFGTFGMKQYNLEEKYSGDSSSVKFKDDTLAPVFVLGVSAKVLDNVEAKLSYNYSAPDFSLKYGGKEIFKYKTTIHSMVVNVNYLF
jgi:opacity protein-like surface antigen